MAFGDIVIIIVIGDALMDISLDEDEDDDDDDVDVVASDEFDDFLSRFVTDAWRILSKSMDDDDDNDEDSLVNE